MRARSRRRICQYCLGLGIVAILVWIGIAYKSPLIGTDPKEARVQRDLVVHVVEEHHEVIPAWFDLLESDSHNKYTIVHIDAHSDDALPIPLQEFPRWRMPQETSETLACMQANDRFIMSAVATGRINRVVFIYPFWSSDRLYEVHNMSLGLEKRAQNLPPRLCLCELDLRPGKCYTMDMETTKKGDAIVHVNTVKCSRHVYFTMESIKDIYAQTRLDAEKTWILPNSRIILDIDEDFFGVQLPSRALLDPSTGLKWIGQLEQVHASLKELLCLNIGQINGEMSARLEKAAITWWNRHLIPAMITAKCTFASEKKDSANICDDFDYAYSYLINPLKKSSLAPILLCGKLEEKFEEEMMYHMKKIWRVLRGLSHSQLLLVGDLGVCVDRSLLALSTQDLETRPRVGLCTGANMPNNSAVDEHLITDQELMQQTDRLFNILKTLPRPRLITLARSSRDGYVPREWQSKIETEVLKMVQTTFSLQLTSVIYNPMLMGGIDGWQGIHRSNISSLNSIKIHT